MIYKQLSAQWISNIKSGKIAAHSRSLNLLILKAISVNSNQG
ncbi:hypothetical protein [Psychromonas sp. MB-3u-54]|nr:hypothetical protein [Psychromonas sp. MB-3u-54]